MSSSETSLNFLVIILRLISEDSILHIHRYENIKSNLYLLFYIRVKFGVLLERKT
jgi:hypothetical protein